MKKTKPLKLGSLYLVIWRDHTSASDMDWTPLTRFEEDDIEIVLCRTAGWLVKDSGTAVRIVSNVDGDPAQDDASAGYGEMNIMKSAIVKMTELKSSIR